MKSCCSAVRSTGYFPHSPRFAKVKILAAVLAGCIPLGLLAGDTGVPQRPPGETPSTIALFHGDGAAPFCYADGTSGRSELIPAATVAPCAAGRFKGCLQFKPRRTAAEPVTRVKLSGQVERTGACYISLWIKFNGHGTVSLHDTYLIGGQNLFLRYSMDRYAFEFGVRAGTGWLQVGSAKNQLIPTTGQWYYVDASYDGNEARLSVDGVLLQTREGGGGAVDKEFKLGSVGWANEAGMDFDGWLDELWISTTSQNGLAGATLAVQASPAATDASPQGEAKKGADQPLVVIPKTATAPPVAGNPSGPEWERAAWVGNPVYLNAGEITSKLDMRAGLLWDDEALYVGFKVSGFRKPVAITATKGDDGLERDDAVEVCFKVPGFAEAKGEPVQFKLNCAGLRDDAINFNFAWNAKCWDGAVKTDGKNWSATFKIPFANFGVKPRVGDRWAGNLGAFLEGYNYRAFLWSPVAAGHHHAGDFGTLEFGGLEVAGNAIRKIDKQMSAVSVSGTLAAAGSIRLLLLPDASQAKKEVKLGGFVNTNFDAETGTIIAQSVTRIERPGEWTATVKDVMPGAYRVKVILKDAGGKTLNVDVKPVKIERSVVAKVLRYPVHRSADAVIAVYNMGKPGVLPAMIEVALADASGAVLRTLSRPAAAKLGDSVTISLGKLANKASYKVLVKAVSADGKDVVTDAVDFTLPERPPWADTKAGDLNGKVLKPWTPIEPKGTALSCWGRTYDLGNSLMPVSIVSSGNRILSDGIRFVAGSGGEDVIVGQAARPAVVTVSQTGDVARFSSSAETAVCRLSVKGSLEFDGFMTFEVSVKPKKSLDTFVLEIPLDNAVAKFIQPLPGAGNQDGAGAIPAAGLKIDTLNTPYSVNSVWVCNGDAGFYFLCDSLENWKPPKGKAVEIIRRGKDTLVRFNFYKSPTGFDQERIYKFYLQATPIRPFNPEWFKGDRYGAGVEWGYNVTPLEPDTVLSIPMAAASAAPAGTFEMIVQNQNDLKAITGMDYSDGRGPGFWEHLAAIDSPAGKISLLYSKPRDGIILETPWGTLGLKKNAEWKPNETHKLAFTWGDKLRFYVDGQAQGDLPVKGLPVGAATLNLGSVSARYVMKGLRIRSVSDDIQSLSSVDKMAKTPDVLVYRAEELKLRSTAKTMLSLVKERGYKITCLWEGWCQAQNGGISKYEPILKTIADDCHNLGLQFTLYFGFELSTLPEFDDIRDECKALVEQSPNYYAPQQQNTHFVSYGSPYRDYLLHHMARLKKELGIDGIYCDGTMCLGGADNPAYGCGYTDADGNRVPTVPVERIREFAKRMNNIWVQDGGSIVAHLGIAPPTMGFANRVQLGEHLGWCGRNWNSVFEMVPLDVAQCIYNGKNTGVGRTLILLNMWPTLRKGSPDKWYEHAATFSDLHRIKLPILGEWPVTPPSDNEAKKIAKFAAFGADDCEWIPYWDINPAGLVSTPDLLMSVYRRADGAMLCIVGNISGKDVRGSINFAAAPKLKPKPGAACTDLITGQPFEMVGAKVNVSLPPNERVVLKIE